MKLVRIQNCDGYWEKTKTSIRMFQKYFEESIEKDSNKTMSIQERLNNLYYFQDSKGGKVKNKRLECRM